MAEERELRRERLKALFKQILDLSDVDKVVLMAHLLISPWASKTYRRYRPDGRTDTQAMIEWLNDRLLYYITEGEEGWKSIVLAPPFEEGATK